MRLMVTDPVMFLPLRYRPKEMQARIPLKPIWTLLDDEAALV